MPSVIFWGKPGCVTNARQVALLESAGCTVEVRNLISESWTLGVLAGFLGCLPVPDWFNPAAPRIRSGVVTPVALSPEAALDLLVSDPILIRRPLLELDGQRCCGFDRDWLTRRGIEVPEGPVPQGCSHPARPHAEGSCHAPPGECVS